VCRPLWRKSKNPSLTMNDRLGVDWKGPHWSSPTLEVNGCLASATGVQTQRMNTGRPRWLADGTHTRPEWEADVSAVHTLKENEEVWWEEVFGPFSKSSAARSLMGSLTGRPLSQNARRRYSPIFHRRGRLPR